MLAGLALLAIVAVVVVMLSKQEGYAPRALDLYSQVSPQPSVTTSATTTVYRPQSGHNEDGTFVQTAQNGAQLIIENGDERSIQYSYDQESPSTIIHEDRAVFISPSGERKVLYTTKLPLPGDAYEGLRRNPTESYLSSTTRFAVLEPMANFVDGIPSPWLYIFDTTSGKQIYSGSSSLILWSPHDDWFAVFQDKPQAVVIYKNNATSTAVQITAQPTAGYYAYMHPGIVNDHTFTFEKVLIKGRWKEDGPYSEEPISTYSYDINTG